jgi:hypothetical protein
MKTPLDTRGSRANDGGSARLGKKQPDGTHAQRIAYSATHAAAAFAPRGCKAQGLSKLCAPRDGARVPLAPSAGLGVPNDPDGGPWRTDPRRWRTGHPGDHAAARLAGSVPRDRVTPPCCERGSVTRSFSCRRRRHRQQHWPHRSQINGGFDGQAAGRVGTTPSPGPRVPQRSPTTVTRSSVRTLSPLPGRIRVSGRKRCIMVHQKLPEARILPDVPIPGGAIRMAGGLPFPRQHLKVWVAHDHGAEMAKYGPRWPMIMISTRRFRI